MRYIAIDTEFHTRDSDRTIDRLFCIAATTSEGQTWTYWFNQTFEEYNKEPNLDWALDYLNHIGYREDDIFLAHAIELAEGQILSQLFKPLEERFLREIITSCKVVDTWLLALMVQRTHKKTKKELKTSYADAVKQYLDVDIDTQVKHDMRQLCIQNKADEHKEDVAGYCLNDTKYLIDLYIALKKEYKELVNHSTLVNRKLPICMDERNLAYWFNYFSAPTVLSDDEIEQCIINISRVQLMYAYIDLNCLPVNTDFMIQANKDKNELKKLLREQLDVCKYFRPDGSENTKLSRVDKIKEIESLGYLKDWPRTRDNDPTANYSFAQNKMIYGMELGKFMKENMPDSLTRRLYSYGEAARGFNQIEEWLRRIENGNLHYGIQSPVSGTATGRCAPSSKTGFIPCAKKIFRTFLKAPAGKILFDIDMSAAETYISAHLCKDRALAKAYNQKDLYLYLATLLSEHCQLRINPAEFEKASKDGTMAQFKELNNSKRSKLKGLFLGLQYGMGASKLSERLAVSKEEAEDYVSEFVVKPDSKGQWKDNQIMREIFQYQQMLFSAPDKYWSFMPKGTTWGKFFGNRKALLFKEGYILKLEDNPTNENPKSVRNHPFQGGCAMVLYTALQKLLLDDRITIHATVHDAIIASCDIDLFDDVTKDAIKIIQLAAKQVLNLDENEDNIKVDVEWKIKGDEMILRGQDNSCIEKFYNLI